jgi:hypothetical protein
MGYEKEELGVRGDRQVRRILALLAMPFRASRGEGPRRSFFRVRMLQTQDGLSPNGGDGVRRYGAVRARQGPGLGGRR